MAELTENGTMLRSGDQMPAGQQLTPRIAPEQVKAPPGEAPLLDDDAAMTIAWMDYEDAINYIDQNSWLMEWQYVDFMYQSPTYDRDWRTYPNRPARISRFNVARNTRTMATQTKRAIFADDKFFLLEARGKLAGDPDAQLLLDAWTEIFLVLCKRANFEYNVRLFIDCQVLQGTAIAVPKWEERRVKHRVRIRKEPPLEVRLPMGARRINTRSSDSFRVIEETVRECWPTFEYRRLGTTVYDRGWRTPNRPDLSAKVRIDIDYVNYYDLVDLSEIEGYEAIPEEKDLREWFIEAPRGDAQPGSETAQNMNTNASLVMHAEGEQRQISYEPFLKPLKLIHRWDERRVIAVLQLADGRKITVRNEAHNDGCHALGYSAVWNPIGNSGYGFGIGRVNVGDQRINQGVTNEALKFIAYPLNAPILYARGSENAPTQNVIPGLGTFLAVDPGRTGDVNKAVGFMKIPEMPPEVWRLIEMAIEGGEHAVGADQTTMQGQMGGPRTSFGRTATGASRLASKADENVAEPVQQIETVIERFFEWMHEMVLEEMDAAEIRRILSRKFGDAILARIDLEAFLNADFDLKVLCGQKLMAKAAIGQLIPFLLQIVQQPQILQFLHEIGDTVNFRAIVKLFLQVSELAGREDIIVELTPQQKQQLQALQPTAQRIQQMMALENQKGQNRLKEIQAKGAQDLQNTLVDKAMDRVTGDVPLELAEARLSRNQDMDYLQGGIPGAGA
jgi:hypothetical protein